MNALKNGTRLAALTASRTLLDVSLNANGYVSSKPVLKTAR